MEAENRRLREENDKLKEQLLRIKIEAEYKEKSKPQCTCDDYVRCSYCKAKSREAEIRKQITNESGFGYRMNQE